jgi:hypothetical protein
MQGHGGTKSIVEGNYLAWYFATKALSQTSREIILLGFFLLPPAAFFFLPPHAIKFIMGRKSSTKKIPQVVHHSTLKD